MDYRAKRSNVLNAIKQEISKGFIERDYEVNGHKYKLRTLNEDDEVWADSYMRITTPAAILSSRKAPRLAVAIVSIDGESKEQLFALPDDMPKEDRDALKDNQVQYKYWLNGQMLYFLSEEGNRPYINDLWDKYNELEKEREEAIKKLPNS
jgi:hypothetical protein